MPPEPAALEHVWLEGLGLRALPPWVPACRGLRTLSLYGNELAVVPDALRGLPVLARLNLGRNRLRTAPGWLLALGEELVLGENPLGELPEGLAAGPPRRVLDLAHAGLAELPPDLARAEFRGACLYLGHNPLGVAPEWLGELAGVRLMNLEACVLERPPTLPDPTGLEELRLGGNPFAELPAELAHCADLVALHVRGARLAKLPDSLAGLARLEELDLRANLLRELPAVLLELPRLRRVDLRWNRLADPQRAVERLAERGCRALA